MDLDNNYKIIISLLLTISALLILVQSRKIHLNNKTLKLSLVSFVVAFLLALSSWLIIGGDLAVIFYMFILLWPLLVILLERVKSLQSNGQ